MSDKRDGIGRAYDNTGRISITKLTFISLARSRIYWNCAKWTGARALSTSGALFRVDAHDSAALEILPNRIFRAGDQAGRVFTLPAGSGEVIWKPVYTALHETDHGNA